MTKYADMGATDTSNSAYDILEECFEYIKITESDVLVDLGCGKGKVLQWWIKKYPNNKIVGIEIDPMIASKTRKRLAKYKCCCFRKCFR